MALKVKANEKMQKIGGIERKVEIFIYFCAQI